MFSPSASSIDSISMSSSTKGNHITSRVKKRSKHRSGKFEIPPLFSPAQNRSTPKKMSSSSRLPFSPLTNSIDMDRRVMRRDSIKSSSGFLDVSREKRVLHFDSSSDSNSSKKSCTERQIISKLNPTEVETAQGEASQVAVDDVEAEPAYEYEYPGTVKVSSSIFQSAYNQAMDYGSHQKHLHESSCNQLSFTEVVIPAILRAHNVELKRFEGKAKGRKAVTAARKIMNYRCVLKSCEAGMIASAEQARSERKQEIRKQRQENKESQLEYKREESAKRQRDRELEKAERDESRLRKKEMSRQQQKKNYKKNNVLWREVACLMRELGAIEKEEKMWREIDLDGFAGKLTVGKDAVLAKEGDIAPLSEMRCKEISALQGIVDGITTSANRIEEALQELPSAIDSADKVKTQVYQKYRKDHKFDGYRAQRDPKALIRALTIE